MGQPLGPRCQKEVAMLALYEARLEDAAVMAGSWCSPDIWRSRITKKNRDARGCNTGYIANLNQLAMILGVSKKWPMVLQFRAILAGKMLSNNGIYTGSPDPGP